MQQGIRENGLAKDSTLDDALSKVKPCQIQAGEVGTREVQVSTDAMVEELTPAVVGVRM